MKKVSKILVPIDFSECSTNALAFAFRLADKINATVEVLHVAAYEVPALDYPSFVAMSVEKKIDEARQSMISLIGKVMKDTNQFLTSIPDIQTDVEIGVIENQIIEVAMRDEVDLIVMGTQGRNSVLGRMLGSTASAVLNQASCPVFVIPENAKFKEEMVVGYATDFLNADPFEIWKVNKLLSPVQKKFVVVHLNDNGERVIDKIEELETFFTENSASLDVSIFSIHAKDMAADLNAFIDSNNVDILSMYKPNRSFFERVFNKSFTKEMALNTQVPLLILNEN